MYIDSPASVQFYGVVRRVSIHMEFCVITNLIFFFICWNGISLFRSMLVWFKIQMLEKRHGVYVFISMYNLLHSLSISLFYNEIFLRKKYSIDISCFLSEYMNISQQQLSLFSWLIIIETL